MGFVAMPSGDAASTASTASSEHITTPRTPKAFDDLLPSRSTLIHSKVAEKVQQPWPKEVARRRCTSRAARSSSEGCIRKRSTPSSKTEVSQKPFRSGFTWSDERQPKSVSSCPQAPSISISKKCLEAPRRTATPMRTQQTQKNSTSTGLAAPTAAANSHGRGATSSQPESAAENHRTSDQNLHTDISSLVEELFALIVDSKSNSAGASAASQGSKLPRPLEAAAAALEPLLLLRDATGSLEWNLELMPWLPQLLTVFRNVMRTSVHGIAAQQQGDRAAVAEAAAAAAAVVAALSAPPLTQLTGEVAAIEDCQEECKLLREKVRSQELALKIARQREEQLEQELMEVQRERDYLIRASGNSKLMCCVSELEQENRICRSELTSIEDRISDLVGIVGAALEA
eukprot:TRINITY_DN45124_c0_g1_i1.p1 TRINITY_DN45124_c0_g1~~TRINITY_DN45124_c0_g1_i1.p1  ORF type:complete len:417 (-),score=88.49 TRINITY_DN45124_c0_g1_i1:91-1293(-)